MKSFIQIREESSYQALKAAALGSSDTAKLASIQAGKKSSKANHRIATNAHAEAIRDNEKALKVAPEADKDTLITAISNHTREQDKHTQQSVR